MILRFFKVLNKSCLQKPMPQTFLRDDRYSPPPSLFCPAKERGWLIKQEAAIDKRFFFNFSSYLMITYSM